jgi:hypothetical protein
MIEPLALITYPGTFESLPDPAVPYYVATSTGAYLHKRTLLGRVWVKVDKIDSLPKVETDAIGNKYFWEAPQIPGILIGQAVDFFKRIWGTMATEAALLITYNPDDPRLYRLFVPPQKTSGAHVDFSYDPEAIEANWAVVGSIHSHCNFSPHHSNVDTKDATDIPGVHMTIGHVDRDEPDFDTFIGAQDKEFTATYELVAEPWDKTAVAPTWWDRYLSKTTPPPKPKGVLSPASWGQSAMFDDYSDNGFTYDPTNWYQRHGHRDWMGYRDHNNNKPEPIPPMIKKNRQAWRQKSPTTIIVPNRQPPSKPLPSFIYADLTDVADAKDLTICNAALALSYPTGYAIREELERLDVAYDNLIDMGLDLDWTISEL